MATRTLRLLLLPLVGAALVLGAARSASAGGFEYPFQGTHALGRGGAFTAKADDPSAMYWNPGKLSLLRGTRFLYNHNFSELTLRFDRPPELDRRGNVICFGTTSEKEGFFPLGLSAFVTSDFGLEDWTFGLGLVGPNAQGTSRFDAGPESPTRYSYISKDVMMVYYTASVAWRWKDLFGVGVSLQYVDMMRLRYSLVVEGPDPTGGNAVHNQMDLVTKVDMSDRVGFSALVGAWVRPLPFLEIAASARVVPVWIDAEGDAEFIGTSNSLFANMVEPASVRAQLSYTMPVTVQVGVRYIHEKAGREVFDIELDFVWEQWSVLDAFRFGFGGRLVQLTAPDRDDPSITRVADEIRVDDFRLPRNYRDTYSLRLGGSWNVLPEHLTLSAGLLWESAAQPEAYTMVDFASYERLGVAFGVSGRWKGLELSLSYAHVFLLPRNVCPSEGRIFEQRLDPLRNGKMLDGPVVNAGHYEGAYDVISVGLQVHFDAFFD